MDLLSGLVAGLALVATTLSGCAAPQRLAAPPPPSAESGETQPRTEIGSASYLSASLRGRFTASGTRFDPEALTAAHRTLPFGTRIRVTNLANDRRVVLTVVDRGPYRRSRILDVSPRAARALGFRRAGTARVRVEVLSEPDEAAAESR